MKNKATEAVGWTMLTMISWFVLYALVYWFGLRLSNILIIRSGDPIGHFSAILGVISLMFCSLYAPYRLYRNLFKA